MTPPTHSRPTVFTRLPLLIATLAPLLYLAGCEKTVEPAGQPKQLVAMGTPTPQPTPALPQVQVDQLEYGDTNITITGWQVLDESPNYIVALVDGDTVLTFPPFIIQRQDVADLAKDVRGDFLGFRITLPLDTVRPGNYQIGVRTSAEAGNRLVLSKKKVQIPVKPMDPAPTIVQQEANITFFFDKAEARDGFATISGWAYRIDTNWTKNEPIAVILTSAMGTYAFPAYADRRPDVAAAFNQKDLDNVGFATVFNHKAVPSGSYEIVMAIRGPDGWVTKKTGRMLAL